MYFWKILLCFCIIFQNAQLVDEAARKRLEAEAAIQKALAKLAEATETEEKQRKRADKLQKQKER